jgi:hypothetical protein
MLPYFAVLVALGCGSDSAEVLEDTGEPLPDPWYYVQIQDTSPDAINGLRDPGSDIYKIRLKTEDGEREWAGFVVDSYIGPLNNDNTEPSALLDNTEADCDEGFVSLGDAGYVVIGFGSESNPRPMYRGDTVSVYELNSTTCPEHDEGTSYTVALGRTTDSATFEIVEASDLAESDPRKFVVP